MTEPGTVTLSTYEQAREAYRQKDLRQALYDEGDVVMADVLVNLHGDEHRARRRLENRLFRRDTHGRYEHDLFPPVVAATLAPHLERGRAELVSLSHEMMMNLAAVTAGVDRAGELAVEAIDEWCEVLDALAQGRHANAERADPVEQVLPEMLGLLVAVDRQVGGRDAGPDDVRHQARAGGRAGG